MVVVNLYRFEKVAAQSRRAPGRADREHRHRRPDDDSLGGEELPGRRGRASPADYGAILDELRAAAALSRETKWRLAKKAFRTTADYDARHQRAAGAGRTMPPDPARRAAYPRAQADGPSLWRESASVGGAVRPARRGIAGAEQLHGKELSYNNLVDLDAAWQLVMRVCRSGRGDHQAHQSLRLRGAGDARGGVPQGAGVRSRLGIRRRDRLQPRRWMRRPRARSRRLFVEAIAAPGLLRGRAGVLAGKKNLRAHAGGRRRSTRWW